ncbi:MAG: hypothetical protein J1D88_06755 [Treponema sp.]|nr:hypothetical protein [Treponema sp.]
MKPTKQTGRGIALATVFVAGLTAFVAGCQTTVPVSYTEPAKFDMNGVSMVGIVSSNNKSGDAEVTTYISDYISGVLKGTGRYSIASPEEMAGVMPWLLQQSLLRDGIEISAADLAQEYDDNEVRADGKYDGKFLKVSGTVTDFKAGAVRLGVGNNSVDVYMAKSETEKVAALNKGDTITVVGRCSGLKPPYSDGINEILEILGGSGRHINLSYGAKFYIQEYTGPVDAVLTHNYTGSESFESQQTKKPEKAQDGTTLKDAEGKTVYKLVTEYRKVVSVTVAYALENTRDGSLLGKGSESNKLTSNYAEKQSDLTPTSYMISSALKKPLEKIKSDMVPTQRSLSLKLAKSDTQNKELKAALNEANKLVKAKQYSSAADAYGEIYADTNDFSAGYNQAVLTEVAHGTEQALVLMEALAKVSDRPEVQSMLVEMQGRNSANKRAAEQMKN